MTDKKRTQILVDATGGIREEYIEEAAAQPGKSRSPWIRFAAAAAVLALVIGGVLLRRDPEPTDLEFPFLAAYAYTQEGSPITLNAAGDICDLKTGTSEAFPGKETFTLDILLMNADGTELLLQGSDFSCTHRHGTDLRPGESDDSISISWLEEDGLFGYRITGWCEDLICLDILIKWKDGLILHQSSLLIEKETDYQAKVFTFYNYEQGLTTEELIAKIFDTEQDYFWHTRFASSMNVAYSSLVGFCGGFAELEQREDAASLLLQRWLKEMETSEYTYASVAGSGLVGLVLAQTPHWRDLTEEELALIADYGISRGMAEPEENSFFPGHRIFSYGLEMAEHEPRGCVLEISYDGKTIRSGEWYAEDEHFNIRNIYGSELVQEEICGWIIFGWFDKPTEITLSVYDGEELIRREVLLITPSEDRYDEYQIDILKKTP